LQFHLDRMSSSEAIHESKQFEVLNFGAESWTSVESLVNYSVRGVHADLDAIVVYHAINDVVAATHPEEVVPEPDYSHWRVRLRPPPSSVMNWIPLGFDRFRLVGFVRHALFQRQALVAWGEAMRRYGFDPEGQF
jgi:hypothetical protein